MICKALVVRGRTILATMLAVPGLFGCSGTSGDAGAASHESDSSRAALSSDGGCGESAVCGNGIVDAGELCDAGALAGQAGQCDAGCQFVCEGACPLRVDPSAPEGGDGSSWLSPLGSIQAAIDAQGAQGGGEVWVRGPGPYGTLAASATETLFRLRDGVRVTGGFAGTELTRQDRDPTAATTITGAPLGTADEIPPIIVGATEAAIEGFTVEAHSGPTLLLENVDRFAALDLTVRGGALFYANTITVRNSSATFERLSVTNGNSRNGTVGIQAETSELRLSDSEFSGLLTSGGGAGISAVDSSLVLERVWFMANRGDGASNHVGIGLQGSSAFVVDSVWLGNRDVSSCRMRNSSFVAVDSHWEDNISDSATAEVLGGSTASFLNSSFVANNAWTFGTIHTDGAVDVTNVTFLDNDNELESLADDVAQSGAGTIAVSNSFSNRGELSIETPFTGAGNCLVGADALAEVDADLGHARVLLPASLGCTDVGDAAAARAAMDSARAFATTLGAVVSHDGDWWQLLSAAPAGCDDAGAVDAGRHYALAACAEATAAPAAR